MPLCDKAVVEESIDVPASSILWSNKYEHRAALCVVRPEECIQLRLLTLQLFQNRQKARKSSGNIQGKLKCSLLQWATKLNQLKHPHEK